MTFFFSSREVQPRAVAYRAAAPASSAAAPTVRVLTLRPGAAEGVEASSALLRRGARVELVEGGEREGAERDILSLAAREIRRTPGREEGGGEGAENKASSAPTRASKRNRNKKKK